MKFFNHIFKRHAPIALSILTALAFAVLVKVFAVGPFAPGTELDPNCTPGSIGCTVTAGGGDITVDATYNNIYSGTIGAGTALNGAGGGTNNTFFGQNAGLNNSTGAGNTFVGQAAGLGNITGTGNTVLGAGAALGSDMLTNAAAIGYNAIAGADNTLVLGGTDSYAVNVGIGTANPTNILSLGNAAAQKFWIENTATDVAGKNLTVAAGGTVAGTSVDNVSGGNLIIQSGLGTGSGASTISFQTGTPPVGPPFLVGKVLGTMSTKMTILSSGKVGIGTTSPTSFFSVGSSSQFQVNPSGNLIKINDVTYSWPSSQGAASTVLTNDSSGNLSWAAAGASLTGLTGTSNTLLGILAGQSISSGDQNTLIGYTSGGSLDAGFRNTFIGASSGNNITNGYNNTMIGWGSGADAGGRSSSIAIGRNATISGDNQLIIGDTTLGSEINTAYIGRNSTNAYPLIYANLTGVGIATASPQSTLQIGTPSNTVYSYGQMDVESGAPNPADCTDATAGRFIYEKDFNKLYICDSAGEGWYFWNHD